MKGNRQWSTWGALAAAVLMVSPIQVLGAPIVYKETITLIVNDTDIGTDTDYGSLLGYVEVSEDSSKVAFRVHKNNASDETLHWYTVDKNGNSLTEITLAMTAAMAGQASQRGDFLQLNRDGTRLFFTNDGNNIYYCGLAGAATCGLAAALDETDYQYHTDYSGDSLYMKRDGYQGGTWYRGLWYSDVPATPYLYFNVDSLCGTEGCANFNYLKLVDVAQDTGRALIIFDEGGFETSRAYPTNNYRIYTVDGSTASQVTGATYNYAYSAQDFAEAWRGTITDNGNTALIVYYDETGGASKLNLMNLGSGAMTNVVSNPGYDNFHYRRLSGDGSRLMYSGPYAYNALVNTSTLLRRDTLCYDVGEWRKQGISEALVSNLTQDGRYYYWGRYDIWGHPGPFLLYRVDTAPTDFTTGPNITKIEFNKSSVDVGTDDWITVKATVSHPQGLSRIDFVKWDCMVDGLTYNEDAQTNDEPLYCPGCTEYLYDDGTHGDQTAGDGIYTSDSLKVNKNSGFFTNFTLPYPVGLRVIAKDTDLNYCLADTTITFADGSAGLLRDFNGDGHIDVLYRNTSNGKVGVWLMNGTTETGWQYIGNHGTAWDVKGVGDFNSDGYSDVLYRQSGGAVGIWLMNGTTESSWQYIGNHGASWDVKCVADFNNDGHYDVLYRNVGNGKVGVWFMTGTTENSWQFIGNHGTAWDVRGAGDFNGDGYSDVLYRNTSGAVGVWLMNGATETGWQFIGNHGAVWDIKCTGDYNSDGYSDVLYRHSNGSSGVWLMNGVSETSWQYIANHGSGWDIR